MVQVVPTGYDYIGGSRNSLKWGGGGGGGAAYRDYFCPPFDLERRDYSIKNNPFLVKFSDLGGGRGGCNRSICGVAGQLARAENKDKSWF